MNDYTNLLYHEYHSCYILLQETKRTTTSSSNPWEKDTLRYGYKNECYHDDITYEYLGLNEGYD